MQMPSTEAANTASVRAFCSPSSRRRADERSSSGSTPSGCFESTRSSCSQPSCVVKPGPPRGESDSRGVIESAASGRFGEELLGIRTSSNGSRIASTHWCKQEPGPIARSHAEDEMDGLMMTPPLRLPPLLERAERYFGDREVVTRTANAVRRSTWREIGSRARRLASALDGLGLDPFDRVATLAWNTGRHVELYYAVPGSRRVLHTLNLRLHADQLAWIASHADDRVIFVDDSLVPTLEAIAPKLPHVKTYVVRGDGPLPPTSLAPLLRYEDLIERGDPDYRFAEGPETEAALLCYTSGTTGNPKGILYSHRSLAHASILMSTVDGFAIGERDSIFVAVPLFHAAGWCMPYVGAMVGAKLVVPGPNL